MTGPLRDYLDARRVEIDAALERYLPSPPDTPRPVAEAMRYSVMAGGKRLRPVLVLAGADAAAEHGAPGDSGRQHAARALAMPAACAVEFIHTYSLIHDDLPAMDDDELRRGRPTSHVVFGEGMAILAGDGLQTEAFSLLAREPASDDPSVAVRKLRALAVIAAAAGPAGMVGGQAIDLAADPHKPRLGGDAAPRLQLDATGLTDMHARKTGALIRASVSAGALMAGGGAGLLAALDRYAAAIGLAFQIVDDILDVEGASAELGKTAGKDAASGKPTYPLLYGVARSRALAAQCLDTALCALDEVSLRRSTLADIARWIVERRQ